MTTVKKAASASTGKKAEKESTTAIEHVAKIAATIRKRLFRPIVAVFAAICIASYYFDHASGTAMAMLYMIAENGKKSGRADGNVYMRNGRIRGMAIPRLVQNVYTGIARSAFGQLSAAFRSLAQAKQNAWNNTKGFFKSDRFGRQVEVTGKALYSMLNGNLTDINEPTIDVPPAPAAVNGIVALSLAVDVSGATVELTFDPSPTDANVCHKVFATAPQGLGINRPTKSAYRFIGLLTASKTSPQNFQVDYVAKYGQAPAGTKVFVKLVPVNMTTGQAGPAVIATATVTA
jgi:hypothetical protein